ncbi:Dna repair exonuclease [Plasmodium coatneyi]|uniref:Dna repair exonuclease n=1 Tax=Plasmodium coatneyi TaxID=208452 RepID=A0A1B1DTH4_9APIC|nr:Dna repair exonuclease [Plasmodium coatneyi]ANQ06062.1 Dna repair exonuclease [Plasmodium coatneyi]
MEGGGERDVSSRRRPLLRGTHRKRMQRTTHHNGSDGNSSEGHPTDSPPSCKSRNGDQAKTEANRTKVLSLKSLYSRLHRTSELMLKGEDKPDQVCEKDAHMTGEDYAEVSTPNRKLDLPSSRRGMQQRGRTRKIHDVKGTLGNVNDIRKYFTQEDRRSTSAREGSNGASFQASSDSDVGAQRKTRLGEKTSRNGSTRGRVVNKPGQQIDALSDQFHHPPITNYNDQSISRVLKGDPLQGIPRKDVDEEEPSGSIPRSGLCRGTFKRESNKERIKNPLDGHNGQKKDDSMDSLSPHWRVRRIGGIINTEEDDAKSEEKYEQRDTSPMRQPKGTKYNSIKEEEKNTKLRNLSLEDIKNSLRKNEPDTLKILLCTDNHLGYKENNAVQRKDTFNSFEEILFVAKKLNVDLILNSGDLFHKNKVSEYTLFKSMGIIRRYCHVSGYGDSQGGTESVEASPTRGTHPRKALLKKVNSCDYEWYGGDEKLDLSEQNSHSEGSTRSDIRSHSEGSTLGERQHPCDEVRMCSVKEKVETAIPFFTIHGNHDYPYSCDYISPLDILHVGKLINYIGKSSLNKIVVKPVLLNKEETKIAIYAIGWIKDERLHRAFEEKKVKFMLPSDYTSRINILVLHQNRHMRCAYGNDLKNFIKESFIPSFVDLVIWGHEHFSKPYLEESSFQSFFSLQLGSSVRTSLCANEYGDKYIGLLEIRKERFRFLKIQLESVRPFELKDIRLANYNLNFNEESVLKQFLNEQVNAILETLQLSFREQVKRYYLFRRAFLRGEHNIATNNIATNNIAIKEELRCQLFEKHPTLPSDVLTKRELLDEYFDSVISDQDVTHFLNNLQDEEFYSTTFIHVAFSTPNDTFDLLKIKKGVYERPLIKLKVEYDDINIINTQLFGSTFANRVGNPSEFLTFYRKKGKTTSGGTKEGQPTNTSDTTTMGNEPTNMENINEYNKVFDILFHYCQLKDKLCILNEKTIRETILNFISNSNSSFNSETTGTSDYCSIISMVNDSTRRKVDLLEGNLRDVPVESLTEEYLAEVLKNLAGE